MQISTIPVGLGQKSASAERSNVALPNNAISTIPVEAYVATLDDDTPKASSSEELVNLLAAGGPVSLASDVEVETSLVVEAGKSSTINLNDHNITIASSTGNYGEDEAIVAYGELNLEGEGTVESNSMSVWARGDQGAVVNIYSGSYKGLSEDLAKSGRGVIYASGGNTINIYGGEFEAKAADKTSFADKEGVYAVLNVADNNGTINVYGGRFKNFNPAEPGTEPQNWIESHPNGFVAEGYESVQEGEWWVVRPIEG